MLKYIAAIVLALAILASYAVFRKRTIAEKLSAFQREVGPGGGTIFQTDLQGRPAAFLLSKCAVFVLDASGRKVKRTKVLRTGFYFGLTTCTGQSMQADGEFVIAYLENRAIGAGGGNTSGGTYRSRDGLKWEKKIGQKWLNVDEAQM